MNQLIKLLLCGCVLGVSCVVHKATEEADIEVGGDEFGGCGTRVVSDVWRQKEVGAKTDGFTVRLSPNGVALFVVRE